MAEIIGLGLIGVAFVPLGAREDYLVDLVAGAATILLSLWIYGTKPRHSLVMALAGCCLIITAFVPTMTLQPVSTWLHLAVGVIVTVAAVGVLGRDRAPSLLDRTSH
jgi:hypothetical protein